MAARSLSDIDDPRVLDPLIAALSDPDSTTRQYASESLSMKHEGAAASLIAALTNKDAGIRSAAAEILAHANDPRVVEGLMQTLKDPQAEVRVSAANALRQIKDARALEPLLAAIDDPDPNVRRSVVFAIGAIGDPRAITPLVNSLNRARNADKSYYIAALGDLGSGAVEPLVAALKMSDPALKNAVVDALGKTKSPLAIAALVGPLNDPYDGMMHMAAANALAEIPDSGAVSPLIESLKGPSFGGARESLPGALVKLGSLAVEPLIAVLHDPDSHTRLIAAATLANIKDPRATSALLKALQERNGAVIAGAYMFYVDRGEAGSEDALIEALKQFGGEQMAGYLLNCGNATVEVAARNWEKSHGMEIQQHIYGVLWGHQPTTPSPCEMQ
jgi:HEAT repeat protein